jgi:hypothetical protein
LILAAFDAPAIASEVGLELTNLVSASSYQQYLDGSLYTHDGHNRDALGGPQHDPARDNITAIFQSFGLTVELQEFAYNGGTYYNVVATQPGIAHPGAYYVIGAHYDSAGSPGADDDASGVAAVLEIARVLSAYESEYTIKYIAFDVEEYGMHGSDAYVAAHLFDDIRGVIVMDMVAWTLGNRLCDIWGRPASSPVKDPLADAVELYGRGITATIGGQRDNSDHVPFEEAGFRACHLREALGNHNYHLPADSVDTPGYINYEFGADMARSVAGFLIDNARVHRAGDCNDNGLPDLNEILADPSLDCNSNGVPDSCDLSYGTSHDCNANGLLDDCDINQGTSPDTDGNGIPDECDDIVAPTPNPMAFDAPAGLPRPISTSAITMTAIQAFDPWDVEYYFEATGVNSHSRSWSPDRTYTDSGLQTNRNYSYKVKARDLSANYNQTAYSATVTLATMIETPAGLTFSNMTQSSIKVTAPGTFTRLSASQSGLYFEVTTLAGAPVGGPQANAWVKTQTITASGLAPGVPYRFRIKARNYYGQNETPWYPATGHLRMTLPYIATPLPAGVDDVDGQEVPRTP